MNYKKISKDNYNLHLINNKRFKTINVDVYFSSLFNKNDISFMNLLVKMITYSSKKYNSKNKMAIQGENLYNASVASRYMVIGNIQSFLVSLEFINPYFTEEKMYEESLEFLKEIIFNPNTFKNAFDKETFNINKMNILREISIMKEKPGILAYENFSKEMYKNNSGSYSLFGEIKDYNEITNKNLYAFYKNIMQKSKIDIVIMGDIDEERIIKIIDKLFQNVKTNPENISDIYVKNKIKEKVLIKEEKQKFNQSIVYMGYKFKEITEYEIKFVMPILNIILGTMNNSVLFTKVREECSYCYNISPFASRYNTSLVINSGINRKNYNNVIKKIKECVKLIQDESYIKDLFNTAIKTANTYLNDYYDSIYSIMEFYYIKEFDNEEEIEKKREEYNKLTPKDVVILAKKMKLDTIYFMEGVLHENN